MVHNFVDTSKISLIHTSKNRPMNGRGGGGMLVFVPIDFGFIPKNILFKKKFTFYIDI